MEDDGRREEDDWRREEDDWRREEDDERRRKKDGRKRKEEVERKDGLFQLEVDCFLFQIRKNDFYRRILGRKVHLFESERKP